MFCRSVIVEDQHLEREVDDSVCELEISEVMEGGKAEKQFVRWQSSDFEEEESSSSSEDDDRGMGQLYMQKMRQAEALKESSIDLSMCDQNLKSPEKGPSSLSKSGKRSAQVEEAGCKKLARLFQAVQVVDGDGCSKKSKQFGSEEQPRDRLVRKW